MKIIIFVIINLLVNSCCSKNTLNATSNVLSHNDTIAETNREVTLGLKKKPDSIEMKTNPELLNVKGKDYKVGNIYSIIIENKLILLTVKNIFSKPIYYTSEIKFQKWNGSKWEKFGFVNNYIFVSMEYILDPDEIRKHPFYFSSFASKPVKGRYRAIKSYYFEDKIKKEEVIEFNIN